MQNQTHSENYGPGWFEQLVEKTHDKLKRALCQMLSPAESEEVIQESYLKLFETLKKENLDNPQGYLYRSARNLAITRIRNKNVAQKFLDQKTEQIQVIEGNNEGYQALKEDQQHQQLHQVIATLPPVCRQVFVLRKLHGYSHKEIAETMNISQKTVENHIAKGMRACLEAFRRPTKIDSNYKRSQRG
ncbi:sigma-70 family RNA polymerase sigma factor [Lacimicrobium sp. SS2-24]|uniref:RNA polymerase sigma factor n=1 Tax=Lacimicrobium sp. SS2-24 TaxID=2005569 RepID=UPI00143982F3|nr:sigma-70 family RNA polymerase sigma factor [Lacimicrobium sp. SS2-24]